MLVVVDEMEPLLQGTGFGAWIIGMPFAIASPPVDLPDIPTPHIAGLGHRALDPLSFIPEVRPFLENLDLVSFDTLSLPDHIPQVKGWTSVSPDDPLDLLRKYGNFVVSEGHGFIKPAFRDSVKIFSPHFPKTIVEPHKSPLISTFRSCSVILP